MYGRETDRDRDRALCVVCSAQQHLASCFSEGGLTATASPVTATTGVSYVKRIDHGAPPELTGRSEPDWCRSGLEKLDLNAF